MTKVFSKELLTEIEKINERYKKEPKINEYVTAVNKVFDDYKAVMDKQKRLRSELGNMKFELLKLEEYKKQNPEMVLDSEKMKEHRAKERELQEQIEEAEMFIAIDFGGQRAGKLKELDHLEESARTEFYKHRSEVNAIRNKIEAESKTLIRKLNSTIGHAHPYHRAKFRSH